MPGWLESFLIKLILALGSALAAKGKTKLTKWNDLREELEANAKKADKYQEVVNKPDSTREDRQHAEDDLLN